MAHVSAHELNLGHHRFNELTGKDYREFYKWLNTTWEDSMLQADFIPTSAITNEWKYHIPDHTKYRLDLLLNPHYKALYRAWEIKHAK